MRFTRVDERIAGYLRSTGKTQEQLADELGMAPNTLSWKRRGERGREFTLGEIMRLSKIVGDEVCDLAVEDYRDALAVS